MDDLLHRSGVTSPGQTKVWGLTLMACITACDGVSYTYGQSIFDIGMSRTFFFPKEYHTRSSLALALAYTGIGYVVPAFAGFYADVIAGTYRTLLFGKALKFTATTIRALVLYLFWAGVEHAGSGTRLNLALIWLYIFSVPLRYVSTWCILSLDLIFGAQQLSQHRNADLGAVFKWGFFFFNLGLLASYLPYRYSYSGDLFFPVNVGVELGVDLVSLILITAGNKVYNKKTTDRGYASWTQLWRTFKEIMCKIQTLTEEDFTSELFPDFHEVQRRKRVKRLVLRKCLMIFAILCLIALFRVSWILVDSVPVISDRFWTEESPFFPNILKGITYLAVVAVIPNIVLLTKLSPLAGRALDFRELKVVGVGAVFSAASLMAVGLTHRHIRHHGVETVSMYWQVIQYFLCGVGNVMIFVSGFEFSYRESFAGLETLLASVGLTLGCIIFSIVTLSVPRQVGSGVETELFVTSGVVIAVLLFLFIPLSYWYTRLSNAIQLAVEESQAANRNNAMANDVDARAGRSPSIGSVSESEDLELSVQTTENDWNLDSIEINPS